MRYHDITKDDMKNGDGLRVVLWMSGCSHHCPECQNPVTWDPMDGLQFDADALLEIEEQLQKDYIEGITLSGGDPMYIGNRNDTLILCQYIKRVFPKKTIWMYTGYWYEDIKDHEIMKYVDVLVDGTFVKALKDNTLKWRGSSNQRVINVPESRKMDKICLLCD